MNTLHDTATIKAASLKDAANMIRHNISLSLAWTVAALKALTKRQTDEEKAQEATTESNQRGYNGADAMILTSFTKQIERWEAEHPGNRKYNSPLSPRQIVKARTKLVKYSRQLALVAQNRA